MNVLFLLIPDSPLSRLGHDKFNIEQGNVVGVTTNQTVLLYAETVFVKIAIHANLFAWVDMFSFYYLLSWVGYTPYYISQLQIAILNLKKLFSERLYTPGRGSRCPNAPLSGGNPSIL
jgi:hypothetical protein